MQGSRHVYAAGASGGGGFALTRRGFLALGRARAAPLKRRARASAATPESTGASLGRSLLCTLAPGQPRRSQRSARFSPTRVERQAGPAEKRFLSGRAHAILPPPASQTGSVGRALSSRPPLRSQKRGTSGSGWRKRRGNGPASLSASSAHRRGKGSTCSRNCPAELSISGGPAEHNACSCSFLL